MYVSSTHPFYPSQIPSKGEELNYYFIEDNAYIPTYSVLISDGIRALENFLYYYDFDFAEGGISTVPNTVRNIKNNLYQNSRLVKINLTPTLPIFISTGVIFDSNQKPLLLYVYSSREVVNEYGNLEFKDGEKEKTQKVLLSSELLTNSLYSSLYRRLHKEILLSCYEKGIEVIIMSSENIQKNAFKKVLDDSSNFSSISVLERYLKEEIPKVLYLPAEELKDLEHYEIPLVEVPESVLLEPEVFVEEDITNISEELPIEEEALLYGGWEEDMEIEANQTETYIAPDWDGMLTDAHYVMSIDPAVENSRGILAINPESIPYIPIRQRGEPTVLLVDD